jgi:hypothetical protein
MKRTAQLAVCVAATLVLTGVGTDAQAHHAHGRQHTRIEHDGNSRVLLALGRLDRRLDRATRPHRLASLTDADRAAQRTNVAADDSAVEEAATAYAYRPSRRSFGDARTVLKTFHHSRYVVATNILRRAAEVQAAIAELQPQVALGSADEAALASAGQLLAGVRASDFRATTRHATVTAARQAVARAGALVTQVRDDLATP